MPVKTKLVLLAAGTLFLLAAFCPAASAEDPFCYECHDALPEVSSPHDPADSGDCTACHEDHGDAEELRLVEEGSALCYQCHDDMGAGAAVHPPVEDGECTTCHNPHGSDNDTLLTAPAGELCFECHDDAGFRDKVTHAPLDDGCAECHDPHSSPHEKLLVANLSLERLAMFEEGQAELCFSCHDSEAITAPETEDTEFRHGTTNLHSLHLKGGAKPNKYGFIKAKDGQTCIACHLPHSALQDRLIRTEFECKGIFCYTMRYTPNETGGTCIVGCHKAKVYSRDAVKESSTASTGPGVPSAVTR